MAATTHSQQYRHLTLPKTKLVLNIKTAKQIYIEWKLPARRILERSSNKEANTLYNLISHKNVREDTIISKALKELNHSVNITKIILKTDTIEKVGNGFLELNEQSGIIKQLVETCEKGEII